MSHGYHGESYEETGAEVTEVGQAALAYILDGDVLGQPYDLRGLGVYGVIGALRESNDTLYSADTPLNDGQQTRLEEVEAEVDRAVDNKAQYFPFGHDTDRTSLDRLGNDRTTIQMKGGGQSARDVLPMRKETRIRTTRNRLGNAARVNELSPQEAIIIRSTQE